MLIDFDFLIDKYKLNITGIIHVGGHIGEEIPSYKKQTNNIHIFEPLKECFDQIDSSVKKYNIALGSKKQLLPFNLASNHQSSSFLKPKTHLQEHAWVHFKENERLIEINTLDSYNIKDCNFLNLDVQGYELEVLKGGINTLNTIEFIFTEINEKELYENCVQLNELDNFLYNFKRVETSMTEWGWGDAFYIKKNKI